MGDDAGLACTCRFHLDKVALSGTGDLFDHGTRVFVIDVDGDFFDRFVTGAVDFAGQHLGARDGKFEAFAAHVFDQDTHLEFAAPRDDEGFAARRVFDADGDVAFGLFQQPFADDAGLHLFAVAARQRAVVDAEGDADGGRVDRLRFERFVDGQSADRVGDGGLRHARKRNDVACRGAFDVLLRETAEGLDLGDAELFDLLAHAGEGLDGGADLDLAAFNTARQHPPDEGVGGQGGGQHAEVVVDVLDLAGGGDVIDDEVEERAERSFCGPSSSASAQPERPEA